MSMAPCIRVAEHPRSTRSTTLRHLADFPVLGVLVEEVAEAQRSAYAMLLLNTEQTTRLSCHPHQGVLVVGLVEVGSTAPMLPVPGEQAVPQTVLRAA